IRFVNRSFTTCFGYRVDDLSDVQTWQSQVLVREHQRDLARRSWETLWQSSGGKNPSMEGFELDIRTRDGRIITTQHRGIFLSDLKISVAVFEDISAQKQVQDTLRHLAFEDALTGVGNRRALQDAWHRFDVRVGAGLPRPALAVLLIDLDGFKTVNDCWGHDAGDEVLKQAALRLQSAIGGEAAVFRTGGDEFAVLVPAVCSPASVEATYARIQDAISTPFPLGVKEVRLSASVGASLYPRHGGSLRDMLHRADQALYHVKRSGKRGFAWYGAPAGRYAGAPRPRSKTQRKLMAAASDNL
ncbi:MAG TPA: GGDEF domain-containing protein, partial [Acidisoma sp.]|nr:GGDEF domain-containing protein [Acidisoma sp.]